MTITNSATQASDVLNNYQLKQAETQSAQNLGKNEFMELMVAQMNNQSPLDPQDNTQMIAQLAQFSSLEEMQNLNSTVNSVANQFQSTQALQASAMVGRSVLVPTSTVNLGVDAKASGMVDLTNSTGNLHLQVLNETGELVKQINLGQQIAGQIPFEWDGTNDAGELMPPGKYSVKAEAGVGKAGTQMDTYLSANVDSVSVAKTGSLTLNVNGLGPMALSEVRQIK